MQRLRKPRLVLQHDVFIMQIGAPEFVSEISRAGFNGIFQLQFLFLVVPRIFTVPENHAAVLPVNHGCQETEHQIGEFVVYTHQTDKRTAKQVRRQLQQAYRIRNNHGQQHRKSAAAKLHSHQHTYPFGGKQQMFFRLAAYCFINRYKTGTERRCQESQNLTAVRVLTVQHHICRHQQHITEFDKDKVMLFP